MPMDGAVVVAGDEEVRQVLKHPEVFSSGIDVERMPYSVLASRRPPPGCVLELRRNQPSSQCRRATGSAPSGKVATSSTVLSPKLGVVVVADLLPRAGPPPRVTWVSERSGPARRDGSGVDQRPVRFGIDVVVPVRTGFGDQVDLVIGLAPRRRWWAGCGRASGHPPVCGCRAAPWGRGPAACGRRRCEAGAHQLHGSVDGQPEHDGKEHHRHRDADDRGSGDRLGRRAARLPGTGHRRPGRGPARPRRRSPGPSSGARRTSS